jgi:hypothetical protein
MWRGNYVAVKMIQKVKITEEEQKQWEDEITYFT